MADDVLRQGIQGISELITVPGLINLDFADVRTIMSEGGAALMAVGRGSGEDRAKTAAEQAISSQLLDITIDGARGVLFNVTGGTNLTLFEVNQAAAIIRETAHPDVNMIFGAVIEPDMGDEVRVTVIATGFERSGVPRRALERLGGNASRTSATAQPACSATASFPRSNEIGKRGSRAATGRGGAIRLGARQLRRRRPGHSGFHASADQQNLGSPARRNHPTYARSRRPQRHLVGPAGAARLGRQGALLLRASGGRRRPARGFLG